MGSGSVVRVRALPHERRLLLLLLVASVAILAFSVQPAMGALAIERVSISSASAEGNGASDYADMTPSSVYVAYASQASNLVSGDTNGVRDIFVRDRRALLPIGASRTTRVSVGAGGAQANGESDEPAISDDGRYVAFMSQASNLVAGDTNGTWDIFVRDRSGGTTTRVSVTSGAAQANGSSLYPAISGDGRYVAFQSTATNLVDGDTNGGSDVFVHDRETGNTTRVSLYGLSTQANGASFRASISASGRYVAFHSDATNLVASGGDTNGVQDVFVRDRGAGFVLPSTARVSLRTAGGQANGASQNASISDDARYVAFESLATDLTGADTNGVRDIFVRTRVGGPTRRVTSAYTGAQTNGLSFSPHISSTGRYVAFMSEATNIVTGDTNASDDVFVADMLRETIRRASLTSAGVQGGNDSQRPTVSSDGRRTAFHSWATNLVSGDTNNLVDVFVQTGPQIATIQHDAGGVTFGRWVSGYSAAYSGGGYVYSRWAGEWLEVKFYGTNIVWFGPKQPNYGIAEVYIDGVSKGTVDCYASDAYKTSEAAIWESGALADGLHTLRIRVTGTKRAASTSTIVVVDRFEVEGGAPKAYMVRNDEMSGTFSGSWIKGNNSAYIAKAYHYSRYPTATFTMTFNGTRVAWIGPKTGQYGRAKVYIDDVLQGTVSQYGTMAWRAKVWESSSLSAGSHTIKIVPTGTKDAASASTIIVIDAIDVRP